MQIDRTPAARASAAALLLGILGMALAVGLFLATPARAQTTTSTTQATTQATSYPVTSPPSNAPQTNVATTVAPTTTTTLKQGGLAFTGADIGITVGAAAIALGAGGTLVLVSRKRKSHDVN